MSTSLVLVGVLVVLLIIVVGIYNGLIAKRNQVDNIASTIDVQLKRRYDLIPNLVETVKAYASHERDLLQSVTNLRTQAQSHPGPTSADAQLGTQVGRLLAVAESYPQLQANTNFLQLQGALNETEEQISAARRAYNSAVTDYNNATQMFPSSIFANMLGFKPRELFVAPEIERQNPNVGALFQT